MKISGKKTKNGERNNTIALIVTVAVLTILVAVAISSVENDDIIAETQQSASDFEIAQEKENLQRVVLGWSIEETDTLAGYFKNKYGEDKVQLNVDKSITVKVESGNRWVVTEEGEVILLDGTVEEPEPLILIEFTIDGTTYYAVEGMTWGEWMETEYNTVGLFASSWNMLQKPYTKDYEDGVVADEDEYYLNTSEEINCTYDDVIVSR